MTNMSETNFGPLSKNICLEFDLVLQKIEVVNRLAVEVIHCVIEQSGFGQASIQALIVKIELNCQKMEIFIDSIENIFKKLFNI